jgi:hypothetical protein
VTTDQITFGLNAFVAIRPALLIARKIAPAALSDQISTECSSRR